MQARGTVLENYRVLPSSRWSAPLIPVPRLGKLRQGPRHGQAAEPSCGSRTRLPNRHPVLPPPNPSGSATQRNTWRASWKAQRTWNPGPSGRCDITAIVPRLRLQEATQRPGTALSPGATAVTWTSGPTPPVLSLRRPSPPTHDELLTPPSTGIFLPERIVGPADFVTSHGITDTWSVLVSY